MHILKWSFEDRIAWSPDDPAALEVPVDPPVLETDPPAADPPAPVAEDPPAPPAPAPAPPPAPKMVPLRVLQERVGEETTKRQAAERAAAEAEERARNYQEIVERLRAAQPPADPAAAAAHRAPAAQAPLTENAIREEAQRQILQRDLSDISQAGLNAYGQEWANAVNSLNSYGANSVEFVSNVMEIDKAKTHEVMFALAQDPEKAVSLARMTPARRISEITRMIDTMAKESAPAPAAPAAPPKPAISRAPAPPPQPRPLAPSPEVDPMTADGNEKMSDAEWERWYKNKYQKRA